MLVEMFYNLPFRKWQFWNEKCHFKIKVDIKWNVKRWWVNISKISPFLNSLEPKLFSKCEMKAISSSFYPNWCHATFILWPTIWWHFWPVLVLLFCEGSFENHFSQCLDIVSPAGETACWYYRISAHSKMQWPQSTMSCLIKMSTLERDFVAISPECIAYYIYFFSV